MWSSYGPAGMLVEKKFESVAVSESTQSTSFPYVLNDIATYFTLLVGIYFPSVTGKGTLTSPLPFFSVSLFLFVQFLPRLVEYTVFFSCPLEGRLLAAQFHPTHLYLISVLAWWLALYLNMHRHSGSQHGDHAYLFTSAGNVSCQFLPFSGFMHTRCNTTVLISAQMENVHTSLKYIKH